MYESSQNDSSYSDINFAYHGHLQLQLQPQQQLLIDEYLPPSECYLENFQLTNSMSSSTADSFSSSEMVMNSSSSLSFCGGSNSSSSAYGSPIAVACRTFGGGEMHPMSVYSAADYASSTRLNFNLNSSPSTDFQHQPTYKFQTIKYEQPYAQYDISFSSSSTNETGDSFVESSPSEMSSNQSIETRPASSALNQSNEAKAKKTAGSSSNKAAKKKCEKLSKMLTKETKRMAAGKKVVTKDPQRDVDGSLDSDNVDPNRPTEPIPQLILAAMLTSPNYTMQAQDIYKYISHNYKYYANQDAKKSRIWKNSVRYHLTRQSYFVKTSQRSEKGFFWTIEPGYLRAMLISQDCTA